MSKLGITPVGNRVIVKQDLLEETTDSGIVLVREHEAAEQAAQIAGTVLAIGDDCWAAYDEDWCSEGDRVLFAKYAGKNINDVATGETYLIMNDIDIVAVIEPWAELQAAIVKILKRLNK